MGSQSLNIEGGFGHRPKAGASFWPAPAIRQKATVAAAPAVTQVNLSDLLAVNYAGDVRVISETSDFGESGFYGRLYDLVEQLEGLLEVSNMTYSLVDPWRHSGAIVVDARGRRVLYLADHPARRKDS